MYFSFIWDKAQECQQKNEVYFNDMGVFFPQWTELLHPNDKPKNL